MKVACDQNGVKHDKQSLCVKREVKFEGNAEFKYHEHAAIQRPFDGRSGINTECREKSGKATRLTGSLSQNSRQLVRYSSRVKCLPARSGVVVCRVSRTRLAFTVLISRMAFAIGGTAISTVVG